MSIAHMVRTVWRSHTSSRLWIVHGPCAHGGGPLTGDRGMATNKKVVTASVRLSAFSRTWIGAWRAANGRAHSLRSPNVAVNGRNGFSQDGRFGEWLLVLLSSTFLSRDAARLIMQTVWGRAAPLSVNSQASSFCPASWQSRGTPGVFRLATLLPPPAGGLSESLLPRPLDCPF
jgi:hypothetical protein